MSGLGKNSIKKIAENLMPNKCFVDFGYVRDNVKEV